MGRVAPLGDVDQRPDGILADLGARQNLRRGHYELGVEARPGLVLAAVFGEFALVV